MLTEAGASQLFVESRIRRDSYSPHWWRTCSIVSRTPATTCSKGMPPSGLCRKWSRAAATALRSSAVGSLGASSRTIHFEQRGDGVQLGGVEPSSNGELFSVHDIP